MNETTIVRTLKAAMIAAPIAAVSLLGAPSAHAITPAKPIAIQIGAAWPTDGDVRDATQDVGIYAGLGYILPSEGVGRNSVDLDFTTTSGHGNRLNTLSLMFAHRMPLGTPVNGTNGPYAGLGIGATRIEAHGGGDSDDTTHLSGKALLGYDLGNSFVEVSYMVNGKINDAHADTVNLSFGTHF
jgi:hypothetical protein